jgi:O-antigen/teichoic acid export membrane protein
VLFSKKIKKERILKSSLVVGVSNLISSGTAQLLPTFVFHVLGSGYSGLVSICVQINSIVYVFVRSIVYKNIQTLSKKIEEGDLRGFLEKRKHVQKKINITLLCLGSGSFFLSVIFYIYQFYGEIEIYSLVLIFFVSAYLLTPQVSSIDFICLNFIKAENDLLFLNFVNFLLSFSVFYFLYFIDIGSKNVIFYFVLISLLFYIARDLLIKKMAKEKYKENLK